MRIDIMGVDPETQHIKQRIEYWFGYIRNVCENSACCEECPFVGYQPMQTDVSLLYCENGKDKKPKEK